jgi:dTDP-4-amino-4,6-dideoxygalactose transaminase
MEIRVCQPTISDETLQELNTVLKTGWFGNGPKTAEFEEALAKRLGYTYAIALNSGTSALDLALKVYEIQGPGELITTPLTFVSDAIVGEWHGLDITFGDIDEDTLCLDPKSLRITTDTKVIIPVDSHGRRADFKTIRQLVDIVGETTYGLGGGPLIIEDAAHAMHTPGIGDDADILMLSFQAVKTLPAGDGGALLTNDERLAREMHKLKWLNVEKTTWQRSKGKKYTWDYDITRGDGIKCYMNDINATIALGQMKRLDEMMAHRRSIQAVYNEAFKTISAIKLPLFSHTVQYYTIQCEQRDKLGEHLAEEGIATSVHFKPLYEMTYYKKCKKYPLPVCDRVWPKLLSLPCHDALTWLEVEYVIDKVKKFYA